MLFLAPDSGVKYSDRVALPATSPIPALFLLILPHLVQALQYLSASTQQRAVQWLTAPQLVELLGSKPPASSAIPGLSEAAPGALPLYVAVRVLDRCLFLQAIAQVESERKWGQKQRVDTSGETQSMG